MKTARAIARTAALAAPRTPAPTPAPAFIAGAHRAASSAAAKPPAAKKAAQVEQELPANIAYGQTARSRLRDHYDTSLSHDLLYLLYSHATHTQAQHGALPDPLSRSPVWNPENPYAQGRAAPPRPKGNRYLVPNPSYTSPATLPALDSITVECMTKTAVGVKSNLLPVIMAFQAITGEPLQSKHPGAYGPGSGKGIVVTRSTKKSASFKIRAGAPTGVKVELKGEQMYAFLETLVDFVLPRLKTFSGIPLPAASHPRQSMSSTSGVVAFGLPPEAMGLFPQIELNLDQYPRAYGMNIFCVTSAKGRAAQDQARALLSGMGLPFVKR
ncbi:54S ribosomal protein L7, mitochondrial [Rhodotorula kratochvilovae]